MQFSYTRVLLVIYLLYVRSIQGSPCSPSCAQPLNARAPADFTYLKHRLTAATTRLHQDYEARVEPALERIVEVGLGLLRCYYEYHFPDSDFLGSLQVIIASGTPEQRAEFLAAHEGQLLPGWRTYPNPEIYGRLERERNRYRRLVDSSTRAARSIHANW